MLIGNSTIYYHYGFYLIIPIKTNIIVLTIKEVYGPKVD